MSRKQNVFFGSIPRELAPRLLIYYQKDAIIWPTYHGGDIVFGVLSGYVENNQLIFSYQHQNLHGYIKTGKCVSTPKWVNNKLQLIEKWEWACDDFSKGVSILEEVE